MILELLQYLENVTLLFSGIQRSKSSVKNENRNKEQNGKHTLL